MRFGVIGSGSWATVAAFGPTAEGIDVRLEHLDISGGGIGGDIGSFGGLAVEGNARVHVADVALHHNRAIFGGGKILANMTDIGTKNINFVRSYINAEGLRLVASDVGDIHPRKVYYVPATGKVLMKKLRALHNNTIMERETAYMEELVHKPIEGDVTLF